MPMTASECGKLGWLQTKDIHLARIASYKEKYNQSPKLCKHCNSKIEYLKRYNDFCCHSCAAKFNNAKRGIKPKTIIIKTYHDYKILSWDLFLIKVADTHDLNGHSKITIKRYLIHRDGEKCSICGLTDWNGQKPPPLIIDHIDGHYDNTNENNFRLICANCDMYLPTYKGRNAGNGRYSRRMRYREGKSY